MARTVDPQRYAVRRAVILDAAASVFAAEGFDGASTAAICKVAGIGSGTLFHYFPDKRSIFLALFADDLALTRNVVSGLDQADPRAAIRVLVEHRTRDADDPLVPGLLAALITQAGRDEELAATIGEEDALARGALAELLAAGQAEGTVDADLHPDTTALWLCSLTDALYFQAGEEGGPGTDYADRRAALLTIVDRFLAPPA